MILKGFAIPSFEDNICKRTKVDILTMVAFIQLFHFSGNQQNYISFSENVVWKFLFLVMGDEFPHIFAFKEEMVVFA